VAAGWDGRGTGNSTSRYGCCGCRAAPCRPARHRWKYAVAHHVQPGPQGRRQTVACTARLYMWGSEVLCATVASLTLMSASAGTLGICITMNCLSCSSSSSPATASPTSSSCSLCSSTPVPAVSVMPALSETCTAGGRHRCAKLEVMHLAVLSTCLQAEIGTVCAPHHRTTQNHWQNVPHHIHWAVPSSLCYCATQAG
jgi:hypothetical protein